MASGESREIPDTTETNRVEPVSELLAAYALGALDDHERVIVEAELARSATLRQEYERLQATADTLLLAVPVSEPPASLEARVRAATLPPAKPVKLPAKRSDRLLPVAAVAAVLVLALGTAIVLLWNELNERDDRIAELEAAAANRSSTDFTQPLVWTPISSEAPDAPGWGYFCRTEDGSVGWIVVEGMHTQEGYVFQLWLVNGDHMVSGGLFSTDDQGRGFGVVRADAPVNSFSQIWITLEPAGGSPEPTTSPNVSVPIV